MIFAVAIIAIILALIFYTAAVWKERMAGSLKLSHLFLFFCGLFFDISGTTLMMRLFSDQSYLYSFHGITGVVAIVIMLIHTAWATFVVIGNKEKEKIYFHKFSTIAWSVWMIAFITGMIYGIIAIR